MSFLHIKPDENVAEFYKNHSHFHPGDSGLDVFCPEDITIFPGETKTINLYIKAEMLDEFDRNVSYFLSTRSSISKTPLTLANSVGIIDAGYRGYLMMAFKYIPTTGCLIDFYGSRDVPTCVLLENHAFSFKRGERIGQICSANLFPLQMSLVDTLSSSKRGEGGFGSTGR